MRSRVKQRAAFEAFYKGVRSRLLLQTWALTGDLSAAQKAVRDALVIAWHHWRKVRRMDALAREDWVRPLAWGRAQGRHSVPHLHRDRRADSDVAATLDALGKLTTTQRKVLLLAHLGNLSQGRLAREVGITQGSAAREMELATAAFSHYRGVAATDILAAFEPLAAVVTEQRWPRASILTRAGSARRRTHALVGALVGLSAVAASGFFVAHGAQTHPRLEALTLHDHPTTTTTTPSEPPYPLGTHDLVTKAEVRRQLGGAWATEMTSDNTAGTGLVLPCQQGRYADRHARATLVRTFTGHGKGVTAGESTQASLSVAAAQAAYTRVLTWSAGCSEPGMQLLYTRQVTGIGDQAAVIGLRDWTAPQHALVVGVARTGVVTTSVATTVPGQTTAAMPRATRLLGLAVKHACGLPGAGACTTTTRSHDIPPLPAGKHPGLLSELDLPPVAGIAKPWAGTDPEPARQNLAATRCDATTFNTKGIAGDLTRTFVIPDAKKLDPAFGLTETVGKLSAPRPATRFVAEIRDRMASCGRRELGSHVTQLSSRASGPREVLVWRVRVETSKTSSVDYLMAVVRQGRAVAQLGFVPSGTTTLDPAAFTGIAERAADRLPHL